MSGRPCIYTFDKMYFDKIDTEDKAYTLGLFYADGSNVCSKISITLQNSDRSILESIARNIKFTGNIATINRDYTYNGVTEARQYCRLTLNGKDFAKKCAERGFIPKKSLILTFPEDGMIKSNVLRHFIRGYFDGDGSICFNPQKSRYISLSLLGTPEFIQGVANCVNLQIPVKGSFNFHPNQKSLYWQIHGNVQCEIFLDWLYKDSCLFIKRKRDKYMEFKSLRKTFSKKLGKKSNFFGVTPSQDNTWRVYGPKMNGKREYLGTKKTEKEAALIYDEYCVKHQINLHKLNFS